MQHCSLKVFINCRKFATPASDWSLGCVSVLVWLLLEPTTDHHLGKQLPQVLANEMRASSLADSFFRFSAYKAVAAESPTFRLTCISLIDNRRDQMSWNIHNLLHNISKVADWLEETVEQIKSLSLAGGAAWRLERRSGVGSGGCGFSTAGDNGKRVGEVHDGDGAAGGIGSEGLGRRV
uniref:Uncharacterized protein n=1 Tax=Populus alba TaxID=43335 RepID=A0A4U5Q138_POPAL|nr:hypothetical protein D5086_0000152280 [Populus alba]